MKHLAALLSLTLLAADAAAQDDPDIEIYQPVAALAPPASAPGVATTSMHQGILDYDADWTANGLLAMAFVEDFKESYEGHNWPKRLVVATYDPVGQSFAMVGEFFATSGWTIREISLAVPPAWYGDEDLDRIFVAATFEASVGGWPGVTRGVRLFSAPISSPSSKLTMVSVPNIPPMAVSGSAELPHAQVSLLPHESSYVVDLAFIDPNSQIWSGQPGKGGQVMLARSFDHGASLGKAFYVTGSQAANCSSLSKVMPPSRFGQLSVAADESGGHTLLAVEDLDRGVIHVLYGRPDQGHLQWFDQTPDGDQTPEFAPRIASEEGLLNLTCLTGTVGSKKGNQLTWFSGRLKHKLFPLQPLHPNAFLGADIEVRNGEAYIIAACYPDGGGKAVPLVFEGPRDDQSAILPAVEIADTPANTWLPRAAVTPQGTPMRASYVFRHEYKPTAVRLDP